MRIPQKFFDQRELAVEGIRHFLALLFIGGQQRHACGRQAGIEDHGPVWGLPMRRELSRHADEAEDRVGRLARPRG